MFTTPSPSSSTRRLLPTLTGRFSQSTSTTTWKIWRNQGKGPQYGATFRVVPSEMWSVQNNLTISNMDWEEFTDNVDTDGIFRGFN